VPREIEKYWLPLVALFTGARLGELCQRTPEDVLQENEVWLLRIHQEGQGMHLKNNFSERDVPIHPKLIELGFLEFATQRKGRDQLLFFANSKMKAADQLSEDFSKHFRRHLVSCGAKTPKTSFHSFRHNFEDACRAANLTRGIAASLMGHSEGGQADRYGSGKRPLEQLSESVAVIDFSEIEFDRLVEG